MEKRKLIIIICLVVVVSVLHYFTSTMKAPLHVLYRELYFIPIIMVGIWGGRKNGLISSIVITLIYLPHIFINMVVSTAESYWGNVFQLLIFNLAGFLAGSYSDIKTGYIEGVSLWKRGY